MQCLDWFNAMFCSERNATTPRYLPVTCPSNNTSTSGSSSASFKVVTSHIFEIRAGLNSISSTVKILSAIWTSRCRSTQAASLNTSGLRSAAAKLRSSFLWSRGGQSVLTPRALDVAVWLAEGAWVAWLCRGRTAARSPYSSASRAARLSIASLRDTATRHGSKCKKLTSNLEVAGIVATSQTAHSMETSCRYSFLGVIESRRRPVLGRILAQLLRGQPHQPPSRPPTPPTTLPWLGVLG